MKILHILITKYLITVFLIITQPSAQFINKRWNKSYLTSPNKEIIEISWAISEKEKETGLSGLNPPTKMKKNQGLFFYNHKSQSYQYWMFNTFFDLDIIFLDENLKVIAVETLKYSSQKDISNKNIIPQTKRYLSRYILELHAHSTKKLGIKIGTSLKWKDSSTISSFFELLKKESNIHL